MHGKCTWSNTRAKCANESTRALKSEEVASVLMSAFAEDKNGACFGVLPDTPAMDIANGDHYLVYAHLFAAKLLGLVGWRPRVLSGRVVASVAFVAAAFFFYLLAFLLRRMFYGML